MGVSVARTSAHFVPTAVQIITINFGIPCIGSPLVVNATRCASTGIYTKTV